MNVESLDEKIEEILEKSHQYEIGYDYVFSVVDNFTDDEIFNYVFISLDINGICILPTPTGEEHYSEKDTIFAHLIKDSLEKHKGKLLLSEIVSYYEEPGFKLDEILIEKIIKRMQLNHIFVIDDLNSRILSNLHIFCKISKKDFFVVYNLLQRDLEYIINEKVSSALEEKLQKLFKTTKARMNFVVKYDLSEEECYQAYVSNDLESYDFWHKFEYNQKADSYDFLKILYESMKNSQYVKILNHFYRYNFSYSIDDENSHYKKIKLDVGFDFIEAYLIIENAATEKTCCSCILKFPEHKDNYLYYPQKEKYIASHLMTKRALAMFDMLCSTFPEREYYFEISAGKLKASSYGLFFGEFL